jgi:hypothetical protein
MHEMSTIRAAVDRAYAAGGGSARSDVHVTIRDPRRVTIDSMGFYLRQLLLERAVEVGSIAITVDCAHCGLCDWSGIPEEADPTCPRCGMPLPGVSGHAVEIRFLPAADLVPA